jgi:autotransporter-associated beta strand protein
MRQLTLKSLRFFPVGLGLSFALLANNAGAATSYYFDVNGAAAGSGVVNGGSYSWDDPNWSTSSGLAIATVNWGAGGFARFTTAVAGYTVTVNASESMAGLFNTQGAATVTINGAGSGTLNITTTGGTVLTSGSYTLNVQGFLCSGPVVINAPISGAGGVQQSQSAALYLYGNNSYAGGTALTGGQLIYYNQNNSFGTGPIYVGGSGNALISSASTNVIILNDVVFPTANFNINLAGGTAGTTYKGKFVLPSTGTTILNTSSTAAQFDEIDGVVSGTSALTVADAGTLKLGGVNTYTGITTISTVGGTPTLSIVGAGSLGSGSYSANIVNGATFIYNSSAAQTLSGVISGAGTLTCAGPGTLTLSGINTYSGATTISGGTLLLNGTNSSAVGGTTITGGTFEVGVSGKVAGNVTNNAGVLRLDNPTALGSSAIVSLAGSLPNGSVYLNFSGTQTINSLYIGGVAQPTGTYGASGSEHNNPVFTGSGLLNVAGKPVVLTQPQSVVAWPDGSATFTVAALGSPTYQWKQNGVNVGGNSSSLTINPVEAPNAGTYVCWLTNAFGYTNTVNATLTVRTTNGYTTIVRGDSPISYWRLDEPNGSIAYDSVGPNNGTYNNAILNVTPGYSSIDSDACIDLQKLPLGQGSFVSVANYGAFDFFTNANPQFTLEGWAYFTNISGVERLFSTDQNPAPGGYMCGISGANQLVFTTSAYNDYTVTLTSPLQVNVWYYLVFASDGSQIHFYVNGQPVGSQFYQSPLGGTSGAPMCLGANGDFLSSGARDNSEQLQGRLDECAIYGTFLGDSEILAHYQASLPSAPVALTPVADQPTNYVSLTTTFTENAVGLDLHYQWTKVGSGTVGGDSSTLVLANLQPSDAGTYQVMVSNGGGSTNPPGATLTVLPIPTNAAQVGLTNGLVLHLPFDADYKDISGRNNNGTNVGSTTLPSDTPSVGTGYLHYSSDLSGPSYNYVTLGKPSDLLVGGSVDFSVSFWIRQPDLITNLPYFGNATNSTGRNLGFCFAPGLTAFANPNDGWAWSLFDGTSGDQGNFGPGYVGPSISDGNWHNLVFVFARASSATTYLDGQFMGSQSDAYIGDIDSGAVFNIGQDPTGQYPVAGTSADMDDLGMWRRTLTQLEVSALYLAGARNTPGVSFAPVVVGHPATPTTISNIISGTLTYGGGGGSQFVLVGSSNVAASLAGWTRIATNATTPGTFSVPEGSGTMFYRMKSE